MLPLQMMLPRGLFTVFIHMAGYKNTHWMHTIWRQSVLHEVGLSSMIPLWGTTAWHAKKRIQFWYAYHGWRLKEAHLSLSLSSAVSYTSKLQPNHLGCSDQRAKVVVNMRLPISVCMLMKLCTLAICTSHSSWCIPPKWGIDDVCIPPKRGPSGQWLLLCFGSLTVVRPCETHVWWNDQKTHLLATPFQK